MIAPKTNSRPTVSPPLPPQKGILAHPTIERSSVASVHPVGLQWIAAPDLYCRSIAF